MNLVILDDTEKTKDVFMAKPDINEIAEREQATRINDAIRDTEKEISDYAMDAEPLDNDGDTSLEDMGEGLEGDDLDEEEEAEQGEAEEQEKEPEGEEGEQPEGEAEEASEQEAEAPAPDEPQGDRGDVRGVPSARLREEAQRRRAETERAATLERQLAEMQGRFNELSARVNAPPTTAQQAAPATPKPDMFADPEGYERWMKGEAAKEADTRIEARMTAFRQEQQQQREATLNDNLALTAQGERGFEFQAGYRALTSLDARDPQSRATVQRIINSPDPGQALLNWFEDNGAQDFRENIANQLGLVVPAQRGQRNAPNTRQQQSQPRHEYRLPSLNSAAGGGRQQVADPEMMDDSDDSVFRFASK
jgi:hypothetical protein